MGRCSHPHCTRRSRLNTKGIRPTVYCKQHAEDGMVDVYSKCCSHGICTKRPVFNTKGSKGAAYCKTHAEDGMVDVLHIRCSHAFCTKRPAFNTEGSKRAAYCKTHAGDGMVNVCTRSCSHDSCTKRPLFNTEGSKTAAYCKTHAEDGMVDAHKRHCSHDSCTKNPTFNYEGSKKAAYCRKHAVDGMVCVDYRQWCSHIGCMRRKVWGVPAGCAPTVCSRHKDDIVGGPVFNFKAKCKFETCGKESRWGLTGEQPTHCPDHGRLKGGLVCTIVTGRGKLCFPSPPYSGARGTSYHVKTECSF